VSNEMNIQSHRGTYTTLFDENCLQKLNINVPSNTHFIIDSKVASLYKDALSNVLASPSVLLIEANEKNKSLEAMPEYVSFLVANKLRRDHTLFAIGGGIIQDITAFLASTMLRGVQWKFFPTTLLSQADSCIGSKSSINCGDAKNILGTFTPPQEISISAAFLDTLDDVDVRSGVGEMLKVHAIKGRKEFETISADYDRIFTSRDTMIDYIHQSLSIKKYFIEADEFDKGVRNVMNYGHSFGHAIEAATNFAIPHGIAVTIGMDMANFMSLQLNMFSEEWYEASHKTFSKNYRGFETVDIPAEPFFAAIAKDKKNVGQNQLALILPDKTGKLSKALYDNDENFKKICADYFEN